MQAQNTPTWPAAPLTTLVVPLEVLFLLISLSLVFVFFFGVVHRVRAKCTRWSLQRAAAV
jgi:hypothetical protein